MATDGYRGEFVELVKKAGGDPDRVGPGTL